MLKPEEEECCKGLLKLSCLEPEKSRNQKKWGKYCVYALKMLGLMDGSEAVMFFVIIAGEKTMRL